MSNKRMTGDMAVYSIGGSSVLAALDQVAYDLEFDTVDGSPVLIQGDQAQQMKRGGTIDTTLMSTISDGTRVTALDCTAFLIGGVSYIATLSSMRFNGTMDTVDTEGSTGAWKWFQYKGKKKYTAEIDLLLPAAAANAIAGFAHNADRTQVNLAISVTINGVAITIPMTAFKFVHKFTDGDVQMYTVSCKGKAGDSAVYPTLPTGTTSLLEKAFNAPGTALAFSLISSSAGAGNVENYSGNMIFSKFSFEIKDGQLIKNMYTFQTQGPVIFATT